LSGENKLFFFMHIVQQYAADLLVVFGRSVWNFEGDRDAFNRAMLLLFDHAYDGLYEKVLVARTSSGATSWSCEPHTGHSYELLLLQSFKNIESLTVLRKIQWEIQKICNEDKRIHYILSHNMWKLKPVNSYESPEKKNVFCSHQCYNTW
jgi:hypothetical protein